MTLNRRHFLTTLAAAPLAAQSAPPNIVFILADDLGYGDLGCYGQERISTPNIDRLARSGTRFTQAYAGSTVCAPSRCALMTGLHSGHGRIRGNRHPEVPLQAEDHTVAELLRGAGYRTGLFGKWGLGFNGTAGIPNLKGFDEFFGYHTQQQAHTYFPHQLWDNQRDVTLAANFGTRSRQYAPDLFLDRALKFLDRSPGQPFFLYYASTIPHTNNELGRDTGNGMEVPDLGVYADKPWPPQERAFAAMISRLDTHVGRLAAKLHDLGAERNTLVIFTSDNGAHREGGHDSEFFHSHGALRGIKRDLYEGGIRVPFLASWPGHVPAGVVSDQVIAFWDFLPTAADLAGRPAPANTDGESFAPALQGRRQNRSRPLYWEFHEGGFNQAIRFGDWKAIRFGKDGPIELYNLKDDPSERTNLASSAPDRVAEARRLFATARTGSADFPVQPGPAHSPDRDRL